MQVTTPSPFSQVRVFPALLEEGLMLTETDATSAALYVSVHCNAAVGAAATLNVIGRVMTEPALTLPEPTETDASCPCAVCAAATRITHEKSVRITEVRRRTEKSMGVLGTAAKVNADVPNTTVT
jgi:hypothetical protein